MLGAQLWTFYLSQLKADLDSRAHMVADAVAPTLSPTTPDDPRALQRVVDDWRRYTDMRLTVVDAGGVIKAATVADTVRAVITEERQPGLRGAVAGQTTSTVWKSPNFSYQDTMYINVPVQYGGRIVGAVRVAYSLAQIQRNVSRIRAAFATTVVGYAILIVALTVVLAGSIVRPVEQLNRSAQRFARGDLEHQIHVRGTEEITQLTTTLNQMAQRLLLLEGLRRQYVSNVSHELRTPLASIRSMAETILTHGESDPALVSRYLPRIVHQTDRLARLSSQLLDLAQIESGNLLAEFLPVALPEVITTVYETCRESADQAGVLLTLENAQSLPPVAGDRDRLEQVFLNLVDNALRYTSSGGTVRITMWVEGSYVRADVEDTGAGIPPEHLAHLFERFYRVDPARSQSAGGTGLGLSIVEQIIHAHRGSIGVTSDVGRGTRFEVALPRWVSRPGAKDAGKSIQPPVSFPERR